MRCASEYCFRSAPIRYSSTRNGTLLDDAAVDDVGDVRVIEAGERVRLLDERGEDALALCVVRVLQRVGLGDLQDEVAIGAGLANEPHGADAAFTERLHELVALDELRLGLLGLRRRRRRPRIAPRTAVSRSADVTGPSDASHTSMHRRLARANGAGDEARRRAARSRWRCAGASRPRSPRCAATWSAFTGSASAACMRSPARTSVGAERLEVRACRRPRRVERRERLREALERRSRARSSRRGATRSPRRRQVPTRRRPRPTRPPRGARRLARSTLSSAACAIIGSAVASWSSIAGRSMTSAHHAANGPSHSTSSTSPSAVPRVVSTRRQKSV